MHDVLFASLDIMQVQIARNRMASDPPDMSWLRAWPIFICSIFIALVKPLPRASAPWRQVAQQLGALCEPDAIVTVVKRRVDANRVRRSEPRRHGAVRKVGRCMSDPRRPAMSQSARDALFLASPHWLSVHGLLVLIGLLVYVS
jgi:hypothetical protein